MSWEPGDVVVRRYHRRGRLFAASAGRVLADDEEGLDLCFLPGSDRVLPKLGGLTPNDIPLEERFAADWELVHEPHDIPPMRLFTPSGAEHTVIGFYAEDGRFRGWYANLEAGFRRTEISFDVVDLVLDVWLPVDGEPEWLDEHEVEPALAAGVVTEQQIAAARAEGARVLERFARGEHPFRDGWETWRPDPAWAPAQLPDGWDR